MPQALMLTAAEVIVHKQLVETELLEAISVMEVVFVQDYCIILAQRAIEISLYP